MTYVVYVYDATGILHAPLITATFPGFAYNNVYASTGANPGYYLVGVGANQTFTAAAPSFDSASAYTDTIDPNQFVISLGLNETAQPPPPPPPPPPPLRIGDHFYTTSGFERTEFIQHQGYVSEGVACYIHLAATNLTIPLYRLRSTRSGDHFYTTSAAERDNAIAAVGYVSEGIAGHVFPGPGVLFTKALHRLFSSRGDHFYTTSDIERDNAVRFYGYVSEGEACWVSTVQGAVFVPFYRLFQA